MLRPAPLEHPAQASRRLDRFLPAYQLGERHERSVRAPVEAVVGAVQAVSLADMPTAVTLLRVRAAVGGHLDSTPPAAFAAFTDADGIRVAFDLRVVPRDDGTVPLSTEACCLANGDEARRTFACCWRLIHPGSAIIRRLWLDAIAARAAGRRLRRRRPGRVLEVSAGSGGP